MDTKLVREIVTEAGIEQGKRVICRECGYTAKNIMQHLLHGTCGIGLEEYSQKYPECPIATQEGIDEIMRMLDKLDNNKCSYDIKKTFGCSFKNVRAVTGNVDPDKLTPAVLDYYHFHEKLLRSVLFVFETPGEFLYLFGMSGSGKTTVIEQVAARLKRGVVRVNHDSDIGRADIIGQYILTGEGGGTMTFSEGLLPQAMREGYIYIADEFDAVDPAVGMLYQAILEGKPLTILETGEILFPHPDFRFIGTGNTAGQGDETGMYNGTRAMNEATMQRFTLIERVDYPTSAEEIKILEKTTGIDDRDFLASFVQVANLTRKALKENKISVAISTRILINIVAKLQAFGSLPGAYEKAFLNRLNETDRATIEAIISTVWGSAYSE